MQETNRSFDSRNLCKRLVPSRLHKLRQSKLPFVSRIDFIRSKLSIFSAHISGVSDGSAAVAAPPLSPAAPTALLTCR